MPRSRSAAAAALACRRQLLLDLPFELQLDVLGRVEDPRDRASFCLAHPVLGLAVMRQHGKYRDLLFAVALKLLIGDRIDEALLRRYARENAADEDGCALLASWAVDAGSPWSISVCSRSGCWRLVKDGLDSIADLRRLYPSNGSVSHFEGDGGSERATRVVFPSGAVKHLVGERGAERCVRKVEPDGGSVIHYMGECGAERRVRKVEADGLVVYYVGERGAERYARAVWPDGTVQHFEGDRHFERLVHTQFGRCTRSNSARGPSVKEELTLTVEDAERVEEQLRGSQWRLAASDSSSNAMRQRLGRWEVARGKVRSVDGGLRVYAGAALSGDDSSFMGCIARHAHLISRGRGWLVTEVTFEHARLTSIEWRRGNNRYIWHQM